MKIKSLIDVSYNTNVILNDIYLENPQNLLYEDNYVYTGKIHDIPSEYYKRKIRSIEYCINENHIFITLEPKEF